MNTNSSRSHFIITIYVSGVNRLSKIQFHSKVGSLLRFPYLPFFDLSRSFCPSRSPLSPSLSSEMAIHVTSLLLWILLDLNALPR